MAALQRLEIDEVFADYLFAQGSGGQYRVSDGWYPVLGLPGSLNVEQQAVLFCKLQGPIEAEARKSCLNGVIEKIRIHRSSRVKGPDTMLVLACDLLHEFEVCQVPILSDVGQLAGVLSPLRETKVLADKQVAYRKTLYGFGQGSDAIYLRIDVQSDALARLYQSSGYDCGIFITAYNPLGNAQSHDANDAAHALLGAELSVFAGKSIEGSGAASSGEWPEERSFFGLGVDLERARELGVRFKQDAIVWAGRDAVPRVNAGVKGSHVAA